ncbi:MAG: polyprenyl synthetase family protein [Hymenobacter sp.]
MTPADFPAQITAALAQLDYGQSARRPSTTPSATSWAWGGKRIRPLLTLLGAHLFTDDLAPVLRPALATEVFHNFTLLHDDIMDQAPLRRGQPTVHEKWNANVAILSGDVMLVRAYELFFDVQLEPCCRPCCAASARRPPRCARASSGT